MVSFRTPKVECVCRASRTNFTAGIGSAKNIEDAIRPILSSFVCSGEINTISSRSNYPESINSIATKGELIELEIYNEYCTGGTSVAELLNK